MQLRPYQKFLRDIGEKTKIAYTFQSSLNIEAKTALQLLSIIEVALNDLDPSKKEQILEQFDQITKW